MPQDVKKYLDDVNEKMRDVNKKHRAFLIPSLELLTFSNSKMELRDNLKKIVKDYPNKKIAIISFAVLRTKENEKENVFGVASFNATIQNINENGKLVTKSMLNNSIYYKEKEIKERGIKSSDYKKLIKYLLNGKIKNNPLKIYTAVDID